MVWKYPKKYWTVLNAIPDILWRKKMKVFEYQSSGDIWLYGHYVGRAIMMISNANIIMQVLWQVSNLAKSNLLEILYWH